MSLVTRLTPLILIGLCLACGAKAKMPPPVAPSILKVYTVRSATPKELVEIIRLTLPEVTAILGPNPRFVRDTPLGEALGAADRKPMAAPAPGAHPDANIPDQFIRQIILRGNPAAVEQAIGLLKEIDVPAPQVLIEAKILDLSEGASRSLGISWDFAPTGATANFTLGKPKAQGK